MAASGAKSLPTIGFLSVTEHEQWGLTGGLLLLNAAGRPVEFHCTAPLKPNRAQEILYGPTLRPFLFGEQIGQTLLSKIKCETMFICTDAPPAMSLRETATLPVVLVMGNSEFESPTEHSKQRTLRFDQPRAPQPSHVDRLAQFALGQHTVAVLQKYESDRETVVRLWQPYQDHIDLTEPFGRIRDALDEAQRGATK
jgi:hypothetical protein